jgi:uncharacterized protein
MTIFALLFGAGIALQAEHREAQGHTSARLHYRRMVWLMIFGVFHAYCIWYGDILFTYAVCGMLAYLLRRLPPGMLLFAGLFFIAVPSVIWLLLGATIPLWPPEVIKEITLEWLPSSEAIAQDLAIYRGGWLEQMPSRAADALTFQLVVTPLLAAWRAGGLMLVGMALLKWNLLTARRSVMGYASMAAIGGAVGLPVIAWGVAGNFQAEWAFSYSIFAGFLFNYWGSLFLAAAYVGLVMLVVRTGRLPRTRRALSAVGRTALSNYLGQSVLCTLLFYGHGFGMYGRLERWQQLLVAVLVWIVQIAFSLWWLRHFNQGPMEWVWRRLTYGWAATPLQARVHVPGASS